MAAGSHIAFDDDDDVVKTVVCSLYKRVVYVPESELIIWHPVRRIHHGRVMYVGLRNHIVVCGR